MKSGSSARGGGCAPSRPSRGGDGFAGAGGAVRRARAGAAGGTRTRRFGQATPPVPRLSAAAAALAAFAMRSSSTERTDLRAAPSQSRVLTVALAGGASAAGMASAYCGSHCGLGDDHLVDHLPDLVGGADGADQRVVQHGELQHVDVAGHRRLDAHALDGDRDRAGGGAGDRQLDALDHVDAEAVDEAGALDDGVGRQVA